MDTIGYVISPQLEQKALILIYPFEHKSLGARIEKWEMANLEFLDGRWRPWLHRLTDDDRRNAIDDAYYFLPHVRELLYPELTGRANVGLDIPDQQKEAQRLGALGLIDFLRHLNSADALADENVLVRLTLSNELCSAFKRIHLRSDLVKIADIELHLKWCDLFLFPQNVGFLTLAMECDGQVNVEEFNDLIYHASLIHPPKIDWQLADWCFEQASSADIRCTGRTFVDFLLQGLSDQAGAKDNSLEEFVQRNESTKGITRYSLTEVGQIYGQYFRRYVYGRMSESGSLSEPENGLFESTVEQCCYELASGHTVAPPDYIPRKEALEEIYKLGRVAVWQNWEGLAYQESAAFLAVGDSRFLTRYFQQNVLNDYFPIYLLGLYQKVRMSLLAGQALRRHEGEEQHRERLRELWMSFLMFRNHFWFGEISFRPLGNKLYRTFQSSMGCPSLFQFLNRELEQLQESYERRDAHHTASLLTFLTFFGFPLTLVLSLAGIDSKLIQWMEWKHLGLIFLCAYAAAIGGWLRWQKRDFGAVPPKRSQRRITRLFE